MLNIAKVCETTAGEISLQWECGSPIALFGFPVHPTKVRPNGTEKNVWEYVRLHSGTCQRRFCQGRSKAEVSFATQLVGLAVHLIDEVANILD